MRSQIKGDYDALLIQKRELSKQIDIQKEELDLVKTESTNSVMERDLLQKQLSDERMKKIQVQIIYYMHIYNCFNKTLLCLI